MSAPMILGRVVEGMSDVEYHADPIPGGSLSSTGARKLLSSPARFRYDLDHRRHSAAFDFGHAVHAKILGVGAPVITYPDEHLTPAGKPSSKAATVAWENEQRAAGVTILSAFEHARMEAMCEQILAHPEARKLLERPGVPEASVFATCPETGIVTRARFDKLGDGIALDLKTTAGSASASGFGTSAAKYGYPVQEVHYLDTLEWATGESIDAMRFIVVEKAPPHLVAVRVLDDITRITARDLALRARELYAECKATDTWPGYDPDDHTTVMPAWFFYQTEDEEEMSVI